MAKLTRAALALCAATALSTFAIQGQAQGVVPTHPMGAVAPKGWKTPRTVDGHPSLEGVWTNATLTTLERDPKLGDRLVLTEEEVARIEGTERKTVVAGQASTDPKIKVTDLPEDCGRGFRGVDCGYNSFWIDPGTHIIRVNGQPRSSILVEPKNGRLPPLTKEAQARMQARFGNARVGNFDGPERRSLGERCILSFGTSAGPPMLPLLYNNNYQIIQTKDEVLIEVEMVHDTRIIRLGAKPIPASVKQWMGDSVGHWEGDTLVVETGNLRPEQSFRGAGPDAKIIERLTRIGPQQMLYQFELNDPSAFTAPIKGEVALNATKGPVYEYACHEGNYALPGILAGARAEEKRGRELEGSRGEVKEEGAE